MNKIRELRIDSTLWATPSKTINLLDFKPEKISIETESNTHAINSSSTILQTARPQLPYHCLRPSETPKIILFQGY